MMQVIAIARCEMRMAWRRRSLVVLGLLLVTVSIAFSLLADQSRSGVVYIDPALQRAAAESGMELGFIQLTITEINHLTLLVMVFDIALFLIVAETIPLDHQFRIRELLDTLPLSRAVYLGGKVLGICGGVTLVLFASGVISVVAQRIILGVSDMRAIMLLWLVMALPVCMISGALGVLATAFAGSRRSAVMLNLLLMPGFMTLGLLTVVNLSYIAGLMAPVYLRSVTLVAPEQVMQEIAEHVSGALALLFGTLAVVWTAVWAWARWREAT